MKPCPSIAPGSACWSRSSFSVSACCHSSKRRSAGSVGTSFLGTPLRLDITSGTIVLLLVTMLTCAGVDQLVREHPRVRRGDVSRTFSFWLIPAVTVIVASQIPISVTDVPLWIPSLLVTAVMLWLTILAEYATVDPDGPLAGRARLFLTAMAYILAVLAVWPHLEYARPQFDQRHADPSGRRCLGVRSAVCRASHFSRVAIYAVAIALVLAEANWAINYWRSNVFTAAVAQLLAFYALVGLAGQHLIDRINRRVLIEFGVVMVMALLLLLWGRL